MPGPTRPLVIELVGPAGAGKSTLAAALARLLGTPAPALGLWGHSRARLATNAARLVPTFLGFAHDGDRAVWPEALQIIRLETLADVVEGRRLSGHSLVLDEGPVYALSWLDVFYPRREGPRRVVWRRRVLERWAQALDLIVFVDAPDRVLVERLRTRAKGHALKQSSDTVICAFAARYRATIERVTTELRRAGGAAREARRAARAIRRVTIDSSSQASERIAANLVATLEQALDGE